MHVMLNNIRLYAASQQLYFTNLAKHRNSGLNFRTRTAQKLNMAMEHAVKIAHAHTHAHK